MRIFIALIGSALMLQAQDAKLPSAWSTPNITFTGNMIKMPDPVGSISSGKPDGQFILYEVRATKGYVCTVVQGPYSDGNPPEVFGLMCHKSGSYQ